jgi:hypothetical protein
LFVVALATGAAIAAALPAMTALTTAIAEDWVATDRPVQLTRPSETEKSEAAARRARKKELIPAPQNQAQAPSPAPSVIAVDAPTATGQSPR